MLRPSHVSRRRFLTAARPRRVVELSCESLYMKYLDALRVGRTEQFLAALAQELAPADEIRLTRREWLAHEDFRRDIRRILRIADDNGVIHGDSP